MGTDRISKNFSHIFFQIMSRPGGTEPQSCWWVIQPMGKRYICVIKFLFHNERKVPCNVYFHGQVDIWAIGCLYAEMLTGDPIFPGDSDIDQIYHITKCFGDSEQFIDPKCHRYLTHMTAGFLCPRHKELINKNPIFNGTNVSNTQPTGLKTLFPTW